MIVFKTIRWKNFLSTGNAFTEIPLDKNANAIIIGDNGAGKSTLLDALTFVLFGKAFRDINKPLLMNSINGKECVVEIEFEVNSRKYKVVRGMKPAVFEIYCDDTLINQDSASKDYQEHLEKFILKMNYKSFTQIVILGSASFTPFMQLKAAERRSLIEDILDIQIFSVMSNLVKIKIQSNKEEIELNKIESIAKNDKKTYVQKIIRSLQQNNIDKKKEYSDSMNEHLALCKTIESDIAKYEKERDDLLDQASSQSTLRDKHRKLLKLQASIETNLCNHEKDFQFFDSHDECPTCNQRIDEDFKSDKIMNTGIKIGELRGGLVDIDLKITECINEINHIDTILTKVNSIKNELNSLKTKQAHYHSIIKDLQDTILNMENADKMLNENQAEYGKILFEIEELDRKRESLLLDKKYNDTALSLLKDSGIKSKIIKQYIPVINKMINKYLAQMGFLVNFSLNEQFEETIKSRYRDEFSYNNFSEGEKFRIDLAILFCWREVAKMRNSVNTNLLILDEVLDGSLDSSGRDEFLKIMWDIVKDTNTFVISHKTDNFLDRFEKVYKFKKIKNFSNLVKV